MDLIDIHRILANNCCEAAWVLLEMKNRTRSETIEMLHEAHAACYHIERVGEPTHIARCEWLLSRAYAAAGMGVPSLLHAERALEIGQSSGVDGATRAMCLEACARAHIVLGQPVDASYCKQEALLALQVIADEKERERIKKEIHALP